MLFPIRYQKRPKKAEFEEIFSGGGGGKTGVSDKDVGYASFASCSFYTPIATLISKTQVSVPVPGGYDVDLFHRPAGREGYSLPPMALLP
ncbi:hypothetical protein Mboo_1553 [Methanoregula boonei 6A8]|uniref:Uncharacterized protein n=1 Tax=Methanoregula boonei (strain DSM 21154 / JCM 14090 / 6A8) TaxID=456442 RepID=A7I8K9_METB6|nr:hypothetical protein Mboo_1553 [Methanoregula boonei 6A8]